MASADFIRKKKPLNLEGFVNFVFFLSAKNSGNLKVFSLILHLTIHDLHLFKKNCSSNESVNFLFLNLDIWIV